MKVLKKMFLKNMFHGVQPLDKEPWAISTTEGGRTGLPGNGPAHWLPKSRWSALKTCTHKQHYTGYSHVCLYVYNHEKRKVGHKFGKQIMKEVARKGEVII